MYIIAYFTFFFFFFNDTATTEIYTLSLHDALPICPFPGSARRGAARAARRPGTQPERSEEHTSELQSPCNLVCRLLLEKKKIYLMNTICIISKRHLHQSAQQLTQLVHFQCVSFIHY